MAEVWQSELKQAYEFTGLFTDVFNKSGRIQVSIRNGSAPFMEGVLKEY